MRPTTCREPFHTGQIALHGDKAKARSDPLYDAKPDSNGASALLAIAADNDVLLDVRRADFDAGLVARVGKTLDALLRNCARHGKSRTEIVGLLADDYDTITPPHFDATLAMASLI